MTPVRALGRLTPDQRAIRDAVRTLARERVAPRAAEIDRSAEFPQDLRELLAEQGILGLPFPERHGGLGADLLTICLAIEALSAACATTGLILAVQELGALPLLLAGSEEQLGRFVPGLASGRDLIAFALTEADAGSDSSGVRARAVRDGETYVLSGVKRFISQDRWRASSRCSRSPTRKRTGTTGCRPSSWRRQARASA